MVKVLDPKKNFLLKLILVVALPASVGVAYYLAGDLDESCQVGFGDPLLFAEQWLDNKGSEAC